MRCLGPLLLPVTLTAAMLLMAAVPARALMACPASRSLLLCPTRALAASAAAQARQQRATCDSGAPSYVRRRRRRAAVALSSQQAESAEIEVDEEVDPGEVAGLKVLRYPHPALRAPNEEVTEFGPDVQTLARNMFKLMYAAKGVGLAAPQVGVNKRLMVFNPEGEATKWLSETILVNPRIVEQSAAKETETEGCLSFPGMNGPVARSKWIKVEAMNAKGKKMKKKYVGWEARVFQHEYDHLDGVVYVDRLDEPSRATVQPRLDELIGEFGPGGQL